MAGSVVFLLVALAVGAVFIWDMGGTASSIRARFENQGGPAGEMYARLPSWATRAFGMWWIACGIAQLAYFSLVARR